MLSHTSLEKSSPLLPGQVVGSIIEPAALRELTGQNMKDRCDIVEFRADGFFSYSAELTSSMANCPCPALLTVRRPEEGGLHELTKSQRGDLIIRLLPHADLLDLEIASLAEFPEILELAKQHAIPVIASFHDFRGTPSADTLRAAAEQAVQHGAAAVKFATTLRNTADLATLALLQEQSAVPMATMGMGTMGRVSRLLLASLGSILNYGYLDRPTVPGQWPAARLRELIRELREE